MERAEFAARLVEVGNAEREALLRDHFALADVELAYILKDISLDGWSSNPARALAAAATLRLLSKLTTEPEIVALCAWAAGLAALITGEMEGAINQLEDAHQRFLALDKHHVAAATQVSKVIALSMLGRYDEAIASALHAREIFLAHGDLLAAGKIEHNIGNLYFRRDHYHEAEEFQTAARERFMTLRNQKQLATINNCLANTHAILHKFKSAEELYEQAVQQAESARVPVTQAEIEGNIGNFALLRGRYDQALDYLERSRRRYALLGMAHQSAISEQEIADAYLELNLVPEAAEIYARVTRTFADLGLRAEEARALASRGRAAFLLGSIDEALSSLKQARELYAAEGNEVGEAMVMLSQAQLHLAQQNYPLARELAAQAEKALVASGGWHRLLLARWLQGEIERGLGHADRAKLLFEETLRDSVLKGQPQITERCFTALGLIASKSGNCESAEHYFRSAIALTERLRAPLPGEEFRTAFFSNKLVPYNELVRLCLAAGADRVSEALGLVESARSRALADSFGGNFKPLTEARDAFEADLLRQIEVLREELNYLYKQINRPLHGDIVDKQRELQRELHERENKVLEISRQLQHRGQKYSGQVESFDLAGLQQQLGLDSALVEYTTVGDELLAFVVTDKRIHVVRNLALDSEISQEIAGFRFQVDTLRFGSEAIRKHLPALTQKVRSHMESLYDQLLRPLEQQIGERRLVVVPHGALHYLPFHALYDGKRYLIEKREISYAPSAAILQQCLDRAEHPLTNALLLGVSDEKTPRVRDEIQVISQVFSKATSLLDQDATTKALRENSPAADVLHLACHAHFRSDNPLFSALRLADGWLTVRDAYTLKLNCGLVTLSACETGVNEVAPGDELIGLARGFFSAGCPSILLSLWMVDDEATAQLMADFYGELKNGKSFSSALRSAQMKMLEEKPHPFFWSPFVLLGRW